MPDNENLISDDNNQSNNELSSDAPKKFNFDASRVMLPLTIVIFICIIAIPVSILGISSMTSYVHSVQKTLQKGYSDVTVKEDFSSSKVTFGIIPQPKVDLYSHFGKLICSEANIECGVYYSVNRVTLREGACASTDFDLPGQGGTVTLMGYEKYFSTLSSCKKGDTFNLTTNYGVFDYIVDEVVITGDFDTIDNVATKGEKLILATYSPSEQKFSCYNNDKLYVICSKVSGPASEVNVDE